MQVFVFPPKESLNSLVSLLSLKSEKMENALEHNYKKSNILGE